MSVKNDLSDFAKRSPKEHILKPLIEADTLDILVIGEVKHNYEFKMLWEAIKVYCSCYDRNIKLHFAGKFEADESINRSIRFYELDYNVEFINHADEDAMLSYFLGCDFALFLGTYDENDEMLVKGRYFYLPVIVIQAEGEVDKKEDVLQIASNPEEIAAALWVLKYRPDYRKRLSVDGRKKIYDMEEEK